GFRAAAGGRLRGSPRDPNEIPVRRLRRPALRTAGGDCEMNLVLHWFLPTHGDGRSVVDRPHVTAAATAAPRQPDIDYLAQVAQALSLLGALPIWIPTSSWWTPSWKPA